MSRSVRGHWCASIPMPNPHFSCCTTTDTAPHGRQSSRRCRGPPMRVVRSRWTWCRTTLIRLCARYRASFGALTRFWRQLRKLFKVLDPNQKGKINMG